MSALRPERFGREQQGENRQAPEFEGEIREFIRRDVSMRRHLPGTPAAEPAVENVNTLIERVSVVSIAEVDRVISELQSIRDMLRNEGERVRRELTGYSGLSQSAVASMKVIADTLSQFKPGAVPQKPDNG